MSVRVTSKRWRRWVWLCFWMFSLSLFIGSMFFRWIWAVTGYDEWLNCNVRGFSLRLFRGHLEAYGPGLWHEDDPHRFPGEIYYLQPFSNDGTGRNLFQRLIRLGWPIIEGERHELFGPPDWEYEPQMSAQANYEWRAVVPLWLLVVGFSFLVAYYFFWLPRHYHKAGHCRSCGYNLTGNTSGVCPECGTRVPQSCGETG